MGLHLPFLCNLASPLYPLSTEWMLPDGRLKKNWVIALIPSQVLPRDFRVASAVLLLSLLFYYLIGGIPSKLCSQILFCPLSMLCICPISSTHTARIYKKYTRNSQFPRVTDHEMTEDCPLKELGIRCSVITNELLQLPTPFLFFLACFLRPLPFLSNHWGSSTQTQVNENAKKNLVTIQKLFTPIT